MRDANARTIYLKDYQVPDFLIDNTDLHFQLGEAATLVKSSLSIRRNPDSNKPDAALVLQGCDLELRRLLIDGKALDSGDYYIEDETLTIPDVPDAFELLCVTCIYPQNNKSLEGLYRSHKMYCTQCEAEGFRKITYYMDRPDVMSSFTTTIVADKQAYPVLLSNGNELDRGDLDNGQHWVKWQDPYKKPAYLFALVAGDLEYIEDSYRTMSGRDVTLRIFVEQKDLGKCDYAMQSLKHAMKWDEEVYGREYDLDIFMIVAVDDFNMGAMENKGLNIFNTSCVLAHPSTTTDAGFQRVEAVVAHEYFHNWSGNRVTCRDWFQLSLKEGFTVFRDTEFSADMNSPTVKRVEDVSLLRTMQFAEDAGPMAHPVRPDSYMEISNFYTVTVYEKGAEVVRMIYQLLGAEKFRAGSDLYFERHDGQAVTCEDFVRAMEDASGISLKQFRHWYSYAGTPLLEISDDYDADNQRYSLRVKQSCPPTPGQDSKPPFHIPLKMGLLGEAGDLPLHLEGAESPELANVPDDNTSLVLNLTDSEQTFVFTGVSEKPVPSLLRDCSAPVKLHYAYSRDDLLRLMMCDSDGFSRWDAAQQLGVQLIQEQLSRLQDGAAFEFDQSLADAYRGLLARDDELDKAMLAYMVNLPTEAYLAEMAEVVDVHGNHAAREFLRTQLALTLREELLAVYRRNCVAGPYSPGVEQSAARMLKNSCLSYLCMLDDTEVLELCRGQFERADNMTDQMAALGALVNMPFSAAAEARQAALDEFYRQWQHEALVVNQWFQVQATCKHSGTLDAVKALLEHPAYDPNNPNKIRSLVGAFCGQNMRNFHQQDGRGYQFLADQVLRLDRSNPQIAARLLGPLIKWERYPLDVQARMITELSRIMAQEKLSPDVYEVVSKSLRGRIATA